MHSASSSASSQTPRRPSRALRAWECSSHMARGTMTSPVLVNWSRVASLGRSSQVSGTTWLSLMISRIYALLERVHANALVGIDEALFRGAVLQIHVDQLLHYGGHLIGGKGGAEDLADGGVTAGLATQRDLIELLALLVHTQNADVADVVVTTGVHASGNVQFQFADVVQVVEVVELLLDGLGDRDGLGVGQRAEIAAGAADHVRQQTNVRSGKAGFAGLVPQLVQILLAYVGQHQVLVMGGADLAQAVLLGQVGGGFQLFGGDVARCNRVGLEGQGHCGVARSAVRVHVAAGPVGKALVAAALVQIAGVVTREAFQLGADEILADALQFTLGQGGRAILEVLPFGLDFLTEDF